MSASEKQSSAVIGAGFSPTSSVELGIGSSGLKDHEETEVRKQVHAIASNDMDGVGKPSDSMARTPTAPDHAATTSTLLHEKDRHIAHHKQELDIVESDLARRDNEADAARERARQLEGELQCARAEAAAGNAERDELRTQIKGLKEFVSTSTRTDGQTVTSDEVVGEAMAKLGNGLQNWVIVHFRRATMDLSTVDDDVLMELDRLVPMHEELAFTAKVHLLQSLVSRILVETVFSCYYVGLPPEQAQQLRDVEATILSNTGSQEAVNQWRSLTLTLFRRGGSEAKLRSSTDAAAEATIRRVNHLLDAITDGRATEARDQALRAQIGSAIDLSRLLAVQRADYTIHMPELLPMQRTMFEAATMEDIGGEDEDSLTEREICCIAFPGIIKRGDESGGRLEYRNVIAKARVLCSPE